MKIKLLFIVFLFGLSWLNGQNHYNVYFAGDPETILVENLTKGTSLILQGADTLQLKLEGTGVQETEQTKHALTIYPNPMDQSCRFDVENTINGMVKIELYHSSGKLVHEFSSKLSAGLHQFELTGVSAGIYLIRVQTEKHRFTGSFVSTNVAGSIITLKHLREIPLKYFMDNDPSIQKLSDADFLLNPRTIVEMDFSVGDQLKFTGYMTGSDEDIEYASPTGDQSINFTFCVRPGDPGNISGNINPCVGATENYTVSEVTGVTYTWTVPSDWTILSGQGNSSISVIVGPDPGNISVIPSNECGNGSDQVLSVVIQTVPELSEISGALNPCSGIESGYSVNNVSGVTYTWTVPSDWTILSGQNSNNITVTTGSMSGEIVVTPSNDCGAGTAVSLPVTPQLAPDQPSLIVGNDNPCASGEEIYLVTEVPGVSYFWSVSDGWSIQAGQNTNMVTIGIGTSHGDITVTPFNECGNGTSRTLPVSLQFTPDQPSPVSGNINPCSGETELNYTVVNVPGVNYFWTVPADWTITSGQNSNSITVTAGTLSGNIVVTPANFCGNGTEQLLAVNIQGLPAQPTAVIGSFNPCAGATGITYSVNNEPGIVYNWSIPVDWTITSGQNTHSISVTSGTGSGLISVFPSNECGEGAPANLAVETQNFPDQPSEIIGNTDPCQGAIGLIYEVTYVDGVSYNWSVPADWTITSGQNTNSITVTAGSATGFIYVTLYNDCGNGPDRILPVTTQSSPAQPTAVTQVPSQTQIEWNWNNVPAATGYKYNTVNDYETATDNGSSASYLQTGLTCNTAYSLFVWAYNDCGISTALELSQTTSSCTSDCGSTVTFMYNGSQVTYGTVTGANNKCWLDRNLGASQVATGSSDAASYGDLFQWGRLDDGHQVRTSPTTSALSITDVPGHGDFILAQDFPYDWRSPQNNNLWQGVNGNNNPCPEGFRLPTYTEWDTERASWSTNNADGAFASPLKLPLAGIRYNDFGSVFNEGLHGNLWSSTTGGTLARFLSFSDSDASMNNYARAHGMSVRCIKD